jgi:hypothetical protein
MEERPDEPTILLEFYKAYLADLGNIGTRYSTQNGFYVSIISALLALLALANKGGVYEPMTKILGIAVPAFACLLSFVWWESMNSYNGIFWTKFDVLREMEKQLLPNLNIHPFELERDEKFKHPGKRVIKNDEWIPLILAIPFVVIFIFDVL